MSRPKTQTERYAHSLKMTVKEFTDAYPPLDYELQDLTSWLKQLNCDVTVRRSHKDFRLFVFEVSGKNQSMGVSYERARSFLAGLTHGMRLGKKQYEDSMCIAIAEAKDIRQGIRNQNLSLAVIENSFYVIQDCLETALGENNGE